MTGAVGAAVRRRTQSSVELAIRSARLGLVDQSSGSSPDVRVFADGGSGLPRML